MKTRTRWILLGAMLAAIVLFALTRSLCIGAWLKYRIVLRHCPDGALRQTVGLRASGLRRGARGSVVVRVQARYTLGAAEQTETADVTSFDATVALVDAANKETPLAVKSWQEIGGARAATVELPGVPDGDYKLRAHV